MSLSQELTKAIAKLVEEYIAKVVEEYKEKEDPIPRWLKKDEHNKPTEEKKKRKEKIVYIRADTIKTEQDWYNAIYKS